MNLKLALPLVLSVLAVGFALQQTQNQTNDSENQTTKTESGYSMYSHDSSDSNEAGTSTNASDVAAANSSVRKMLSSEQAKEKISSQLSKQDRGYRILSRAIVLRSAEFTSVEIYNQILPTAPYFLGSIKVKLDSQNRTVAFQIDRLSGKALLYLGSAWVGLENVDVSGIFHGAMPESRSRAGLAGFQQTPVNPKR